MTLTEFKATLASNTPPDVPPALVAIWHDAKGDWDAAHNTAQNVEDATGAWVHAYLHRKEGDASNAAYWYHQAEAGCARHAGRGVGTDRRGAAQVPLTRVSG